MMFVHFESFIGLLCIITLVWHYFLDSRLFLFCCNKIIIHFSLVVLTFSVILNNNNPLVDLRSRIVVSVLTIWLSIHSNITIIMTLTFQRSHTKNDRRWAKLSRSYFPSCSKNSIKEHWSLEHPSKFRLFISRWLSWRLGEDDFTEFNQQQTSWGEKPLDLHFLLIRGFSRVRCFEKII